MKPRDLLAVAGISTIVVIAGVWFALIAPKHNEAGRLAHGISQQQTALNTARDQIKVYDAARDAYPANYAAVARLGKAIPPSADTASLIEQLSQSSKVTHVRFRGVSVTPVAPVLAPAAAMPGTATPVGGPTANPFQFTFQGRFFRLSRFLRYLERYVDVRNGGLIVDGRLLTIDGFTLGDQQNTAPGGSDVAATVQARAYSIADLLNGATPGAPAPATSGGGSSVTPPAALVTP